MNSKLKRLAALMLAMVLCLGALSACGDKKEDAPEEDPAGQSQDVNDDGSQDQDTQQPADDTNADDADPAGNADPADSEAPEGDSETPDEGESTT